MRNKQLILSLAALIGSATVSLEAGEEQKVEATVDDLEQKVSDFKRRFDSCLSEIEEAEDYNQVNTKKARDRRDRAHMGTSFILELYNTYFLGLNNEQKGRLGQDKELSGRLVRMYSAYSSVLITDAERDGQLSGDFLVLAYESLVEQYKFRDLLNKDDFEKIKGKLDVILEGFERYKKQLKDYRTIGSGVDGVEWKKDPTKEVEDFRRKIEYEIGLMGVNEGVQLKDGNSALENMIRCAHLLTVIEDREFVGKELQKETSQIYRNGMAAGTITAGCEKMAKEEFLITFNEAKKRYNNPE